MISSHVLKMLRKIFQTYNAHQDVLEIHRDEFSRRHGIQHIDVMLEVANYHDETRFSEEYDGPMSAEVRRQFDDSERAHTLAQLYEKEQDDVKRRHFEMNYSVSVSELVPRVRLGEGHVNCEDCEAIIEESSRTTDPENNLKRSAEEVEVRSCTQEDPQD